MYHSLRGAVSAVALHSPLPELILRKRAWRRLTVIAYHRLGPRAEESHPFDDNVVSATPEEFSRELRFFRRHLDVISLTDLSAALDGRAKLPPRPALITFDDGYADSYELAFPLLREHGLPAVFFVPTALLGTAQIPWWDQVACCLKFSRVGQVPSPFGGDDPPYAAGPGCRQASIRRFLFRLRQCPWPEAWAHVECLREATGVDPSDYASRPLLMSWEAAREMAEAGMEIGSHTRTHPVLGRVRDLRVRWNEIRGSFEDLQEALGREPLAFAYPVGTPATMSAEADAQIREAGYRLSFSYQQGMPRLSDADRFRLPRLHAEFGDDYGAFRLRMALGPGRRASLPAVTGPADGRQESAPASEAGPAETTVEVIRDAGTWQALQAEWRELFAASPTAAPPLSWDWLWEWWKLYGADYGLYGAGLRVYTVRRGRRLIGALPMYLARRDRLPFAPRRLRFLSTGEAEHEETCAEYLDLLHLPGEAGACAEGLRPALLGSGKEWDELLFSRLPGGSPLLAWGNGARDGAERVILEPRGPGRVAALAGGFEAYLGRLSPDTRWRARRLLREVEAAGVRFEVAAERESADLFFGQLERLHQERWQAAGRPGCFAAPRFAQFHRTLHQRWVPSGEAVLARLTAGGEPLAVVSGYITGDRLHFYMMGTRMDATGPVRSPGVAAHLLLMAWAAERGIAHYDLLAGEHRYKMQLATEERAMAALRIERPSFRRGAYAAANLARRALRKGAPPQCSSAASPEG